MIRVQIIGGVGIGREDTPGFCRMLFSELLEIRPLLPWGVRVAEMEPFEGRCRALLDRTEIAKDDAEGTALLKALCEAFGARVQKTQQQVCTWREGLAMTYLRAHASLLVGFVNYMQHASHGPGCPAQDRAMQYVEAAAGATAKLRLYFEDARWKLLDADVWYTDQHLPLLQAMAPIAQRYVRAVLLKRSA